MLILPCLVGFLAGVISGMGVGGGTILMVYLTAILSMDQKAAQGLNLLYFLPTAGASLLLHRKNNYLETGSILPAAISGALAAALFSLIAMYLNVGLLKKLFGIYLIITGLSECFQKAKNTPGNQP